MESYLYHALYDLITPDGKITHLSRVNESNAVAQLRIEGISPAFVGWEIERELIFFNLKSTLAQLGVDSVTKEIALDQEAGVAEVEVVLQGIGELGQQMLALIDVGQHIGKLFAADLRRRVRDPDYLLRMFGRVDQWGRPLLSLGGMEGSQDLVFEVVEGRTVAYIGLKSGNLTYGDAIQGLLPTIAKSLRAELAVRDLLPLHQQWQEGASRVVEPNRLLLVKTAPLHVRTVFGAVVNELLPQGFRHTTASVLQPDTMHSGDIYELHGTSSREIHDIPLEFFTLEPHREYVFFHDRDQLQADLEDQTRVFDAFETAPPPPGQAAVFVVKGHQMRSLQPSDWVARDARMHEFPGTAQASRQALMVERYIQKQAAFPFLMAMEDGLITSQGILLTRYLPSPLLKRLLLSDSCYRLIKGIYFQQPSASGGDFFSAEDRALLHDLAKFGIPIYWVDRASGKILLYVPRHNKDCGMFVPQPEVHRFQRATFLGVYGSNLIEGNFTQELGLLLQGMLEMRASSNHPLFNPDTPLALVTGGGPGAMEVGNRLAQEMGVLSCANIVDFRPRDGSVVNEQKQNPYVEAKMTYRLDHLVERQAEFHLDLPIFLQGGIGTDFEYAIEEVRRKTGTAAENPILLFGSPDYWQQKITSRFQCNREAGTIKGSEWVSNAFFCVQTGAQALRVYRDFFEGRLIIGSEGPIADDGFITVD